MKWSESVWEKVDCGFSVVWLAADVSVFRFSAVVMFGVGMLLSYRGRALCCHLKLCDLLLLWRLLQTFVQALISGSTFCLLWNIADWVKTVRTMSDTEWLWHKYNSRKTSRSVTSLHNNRLTKTQKLKAGEQKQNSRKMSSTFIESFCLKTSNTQSNKHNLCSDDKMLPLKLNWKQSLFQKFYFWKQ